MKIDAHQHFWQYNPGEYDWMSDEMHGIKRDFMPADLLPLLHAVGFDGTVAVQARQHIAETNWLLSLAEEHDIIKGVVGWIDMLADDVDQVLASLSQNKYLVGVRHVLHDEPDDYFMLRPAFKRGIAALEKYNLTYDLLIFPRHIPIAVELVRSFPKQRFVVDHIAKPPIKSHLSNSWSSDLKVLAHFPNVFCKLSGMVTEADWNLWRKDDFSFYLAVVLDAFGTDRVMIGSDWPVCTLAARYEDTMHIVSDFISRLDLETRNKILGGNCMRFYNIQY